MIVKKTLVALAAAAIVIPGTVAASVSSGTSLGGQTTMVETSEDGLTRVSGSARYYGALAGSGLQLIIECDAEGIGATASTHIDACYALVGGKRYDAIELNLPGNATASAGTFNVPLAPITVCIEASATPILGDDVTGSSCVQSTVIGDIDVSGLTPAKG